MDTNGPKPERWNWLRTFWRAYRADMSALTAWRFMTTARSDLREAREALADYEKNGGISLEDLRRELKT